MDMCIQSARHGLVALDDSYMFRLIYWIVNTCNECAGYELVLIQSLGPLLYPQDPLLCPRSVIVRRLQYEGSRILNRTVSLLVLPFFEKRANVLKKLFYAYVRKVRTCPNGPLCPQDPLLCPQGPLLYAGYNMKDLEF